MHKPLSKTQIKQLNKQLSAEYSDQKELVFILQDVEDPINVGAFFRLADALGAELLLTGKTPKPPHGGIGTTARGLERSVPWEYFDEISQAINTVKEFDYQVVGVELTHNAKAFDKFKYSSKVALVMGNEASGIYKKNLELLDSIVAIPMFGKGPSLNVQVAAAVVGYKALSN